MTKINLPKFFSFLVFLSYSFNSIAQNPVPLDHNLFIEKLKNAENLQYKDFLHKYDSYLKSHPNDFKIYIEKIEFVDNAQYDEMEEYNPNQDYSDSLKEEIFKKFSNIPEIQIFKISKIWGDEKKEYLKELQGEIEAGESKLNDEQIAKVYLELATEDYNDNKFKQAKFYIEKAIPYDISVSYSQIYAKVLIELNEKDLALKVLNDKRDTISNVYYLSQKANLFLILKSFKNAIELYKAVDKIDTSYNNRLELANALEGAGLYDEARAFLIKDTSKVWGKESSYYQLFLHDLKFGSSPDALSSYNSYRKFGYEYDKMAFYRIRLFFKNPLLIWSFRDLLGVFTLAFVLILILSIPSIFILPVYIIWQRKYSLPETLHPKFVWGLKSVWISFILFGIVTIISASTDIELLYASFDILGSPKEFSNETLALSSLLFISFMFVFSMAFLKKCKASIFKPQNISIIRAIGLGIGYFFIFKIFSGIYIQTGRHIFDINPSDLGINKYLLFSAKDQIKAEIIVYGLGTSILMTSVLVPIYEELIFRGVLLGAFLKRMSFRYSNLLQASLFSILHQDLFLFPVFLLFGVFSGVLTKKTQSILPNIIFHILNNLFATLLIYKEIL